MTTRQGTKTKPQTPIEKLLSDKEELHERCLRQQQKLNDDLLYVQENAAALFVSGFTALLFPNKTTPPDAAVTTGNTRRHAEVDYPGIVKELLPVAWSIVKPVLLTWGIRKIQGLFADILCRKKSRT